VSEGAGASRAAIFSRITGSRGGILGGPTARRFLGDASSDDAPSDDDECSTAGLFDAEDQCDYVRANCGGIVNFVNYLSLVYCNESYGLIWPFLVAWLVLLISLLATTADYFFVPALEYLSFDILELSPEVAGITLLALGNGAPDVFGALAGITGQDDFQIALGALCGASIFISSVVLGMVLLVAEPQASVDPASFQRDVLTYLATVASIVFVAFDGKVTIYEASGLLSLYVLYVVYVILLSEKRRRSEKQASFVSTNSGLNKEIEGTIEDDLSASLIATGTSAPPQGDNEVDLKYLESSMLLRRRSLSGASFHRSSFNGRLSFPIANDDLRLSNPDSLHATGELPPHLSGLSWQLLPDTFGPGARALDFLLRCQLVFELPFTLARWLSCPAADGHWDLARKRVAVVSPLGFAVILQLDAFGLDAFSNPGVPLAVIMLLGAFFSAAIYADTQESVTTRTTLPRCYPVLVILAFASSVVWMDLVAGELVALMEAVGIALGISTAILGLTVLALGNSVGDLVADLAVARAGQAKMAVATCFGSPLLNDILGLGIALLVATAGSYPEPFRGGKLTNGLYVAWSFLVASLLMSLAVFHSSGYTPSRAYAYALFALYATFVVVSILGEVGVLIF
jgi:sodium/potassium/calcium exchanger 6